MYRWATKCQMTNDKKMTSILLTTSKPVSIQKEDITESFTLIDEWHGDLVAFHSVAIKRNQYTYSYSTSNINTCLTKRMPMLSFATIVGTSLEFSQWALDIRFVMDKDRRLYELMAQQQRTRLCPTYWTDLIRSSWSLITLELNMKRKNSVVNNIRMLRPFSFRS